MHQSTHATLSARDQLILSQMEIQARTALQVLEYHLPPVILDGSEEARTKRVEKHALAVFSAKMEAARFLRDFLKFRPGMK